MQVVSTDLDKKIILRKETNFYYMNYLSFLPQR